ncbi:hypothetical protein MCAG_04919 [Micromonospora sp. ATCC 39149]|uniref:Uncharacterized protein n=1 Tax=Micromonospora carbonacea TaxID=47853 RepID=A0A7D5YHG0_9ACTN|nr:hypothetical protein [Micromonospora sp. ATCC 39149]EEP74592.1 hypothetical protein MCAG_04919 [Micromonospora sp. ATCC 39149]QLK00416.1 hypothetical protein HZU44_10380 [Micromonospora carbonacea]
MDHPERRLLISVDMERYSRRSNLQQYEAQQAFHELLHSAAEAVGLDRVAWSTQQAGDGELAILPRDVPEARVIGRFVPELNRRLRAYNSSRLPAARVRLRIAVHQGLVHLDGANGFPGNAVVFVSRLCDADPVRRALAAFHDAGVALVVSAEIFRDVVSEYPEEMRPERFRRVRISKPDKGFDEFAWLCVVDEDLSSWPALAGDGPDDPRGVSDDGAAGVPAGPPPGPSRPDAGGRATADGIRTGDVRVRGQNAIGPGATAIGSVGRDAILGRGGGDR